MPTRVRLAVVITGFHTIVYSGIVTSFEVPGAGSMMLYQPRRLLAHQL